MRLAHQRSPGHPDQASDLIAESIIDEYLRRDPASSLRVHVTGGRGAIFVTGIQSSQADFDVGAIVKQAAASLGCIEDIEPFVSIESVPGAQLLDRNRSGQPIYVTGYATTETDELIPRHVYLAKRITKKLEDARTTNPDWFWLEPGFDVHVTEPRKGSPIAYIRVAHGKEELVNVRDRIKQLIQPINEQLHIIVNENGSLDKNGLDTDIGASGIPVMPYGSGIISHQQLIGHDPSHPGKFGTWLARVVAIDALKRSQSKAVMVQAIYHPKDAEPSYLQVRNEQGENLTTVQDRDTMRYSRLIELMRPGLNKEAAMWGFAGELNLPWETPLLEA